MGDTTGLTSREAEKRLGEFGPNLIKTQEVTRWQIWWRQFKSPLVYLLIGAGVLDMGLGNLEDGVIILTIVFINAILGWYQEQKSEQIVRLLKKYIAPQSRVMRDGVETMVESQTIVPGDSIVMHPGDIIPADVKWVKTYNMELDESILTGEAEPVTATVLGFAGTTVVRGRGEGIVTQTGIKTRWGEVARETVETHKKGGFEKDLAKFSGFILKLIIVTLLVLYGANFGLKHGKVSPTELAIFSVALAVSVIPEALPVVITFSLSRGALRLAKNKVVVKRLAAVEDVGNIEILCTDKTGTLTENKLTIEDLRGESREEVLKMGAIMAIPAVKAGEVSDAFDLALWNAIDNKIQEKYKKEYEVVEEIPFDPERRRSVVLVKSKQGYEMVIRGAAEAVWPLCKNMTEAGIKKENEWLAGKGREGHRAIALARKIFLKKPKNLVAEEKGAEWIGMVAFVDPVKQTTFPAVERSAKLGVKIKILTGDGPEVAGTVAHQIGLIGKANEVITGDELDKLPVGEQHIAVEKYQVFARVSPTQKKKIIDLLREKYRVGFLGEGINDAPALKSANVGLVVQHASDIAREAADIILLKKDLKVIVEGVEEGRVVWANTQKYITTTLASNFGNFYAVSVASLLVDYLPLLPLQILLVNALTDLPMIAIATDNVDPEEVRKPQTFNLRNLVWIATTLGLVSTVFDFIFFGLFRPMGEGRLQTYWFMGSVLTELVFMMSIRTRGFFLKAKRPAIILLVLTVGAAGLGIGLPFTNVGASVFKFVLPNMTHLGMVVGVVIAYLAVTEAAKLAYYNYKGKIS